MAQWLSGNLAYVAEIIAFVVMVVIIARWAYPRVIAAAEARQRMLTEQLETAERGRREAERQLQDVERRLQQTREQASELMDGARRSAERLQAELAERAEEESRRVVEAARREIEAERRRAIDSIRGELADLVVGAAEAVVARSLDDRLHGRMIEDAIANMGSKNGGARR
jgi:F-type H+-transporting ATPase subunit b